MTKVRTRFAPSPTGYLHIGSARTALFAWAYARKHAGQFILRIEDTDRERSTQASIDAILQGMDWLGFEYDEGPFYQTQRMDRYQVVLQQLLDSGHAYRCTCSKERLEQLRESQLSAKQKPRYDGKCRHAAYGADVGAHVIRFKNPDSGAVSFHDAVHGEISVSNAELDDLIIARTDGTPTYNFTVVVDDADMQITHVIRGDDHINNTPRQVNMLDALGLAIPSYAHVPMILGSDGSRLSKRHGAVSVMQYRDEGFLSDAFCNYLARLGWSHGDDEVFSRDEFLELFDLSGINKAAASINPDKLIWLNQQYLKNTPPAHMVDALAWHMQQAQIDVSQGPDLTALLQLQAERCKTLVEIVEKSRYFYQEPAGYDEKARTKFLTEDSLPWLQQVLQAYRALDNWQAEPIHAIILSSAESLDIKLGKLAQAIRLAMTGNTVSPPLDATLAALGKDRVIARLQRAIETIQRG